MKESTKCFAVFSMTAIENILDWLDNVLSQCKVVAKQHDDLLILSGQSNMHYKPRWVCDELRTYFNKSPAERKESTGIVSGELPQLRLHEEFLKVDSIASPTKVSLWLGSEEINIEDPADREKAQKDLLDIFANAFSDQELSDYFRTHCSILIRISSLMTCTGISDSIDSQVRLLSEPRIGMTSVGSAMELALRPVKISTECERVLQLHNDALKLKNDLTRMYTGGLSNVRAKEMILFEDTMQDISLIVSRSKEYLNVESGRL